MDKTTTPGIQIRITDPALQAYVQRHPFATGPDPAMNERARNETSSGIYFRQPGPTRHTTLLTPGQATLPPAEAAAITAILTKVGMDAARQQYETNDFNWEMTRVPRNAKSVLAVGCGQGIELLFLRAVLPNARLTAIDYTDTLIPGLREATSVTMHAGDMNQLLQDLNPEYDLIFSNHTMEHLYDPDQTLATLHRLLLPGGHILSTMPMVGQADSPFIQQAHAFLHRKAADPTATIAPVDLVYFDLGHPWKTNPSDIAATLTRAGFTDVEIYQRRDHLSRPAHISKPQLDAQQKSATSLHGLLVKPMHAIARALGTSAPHLLLRIIYAIEHRIPFGTNRAMSALNEEACFLARKP